ncbi:hypothetical protein [Nocardia cyriacigeorgica]|uniref:Uncharacterized protein n=1 Tax=Nocardia cyriacigeorgica TaxID=135487 RepID=A0A4V6IBL9_9NOCA|nr:hypothetical protein [Nocardia cyriacigeorgica]MBF6325833.1 hypothetical protein [Nocardia cyriacigeorgica]VFA96313.1 Uncharacterised protein [Nocardia cyriacigeorgica]
MRNRTSRPAMPPPLSGARLEAAITERLRHYRQVCALDPVRRGHTLLVRTGEVAAIELPADRARAVLDRLPVPAPIIVVHDPFDARWVLLTGPLPHPAPDSTAFADMRARLLPAGTEVALPTPGDDESVTWRHQRLPDDAYRPSVHDVLDAISSAVVGAR